MDNSHQGMKKRSQATKRNKTQKTHGEHHHENEGEVPGGSDR